MPHRSSDILCHWNDQFVSYIVMNIVPAIVMSIHKTLKMSLYALAAFSWEHAKRINVPLSGFYCNICPFIDANREKRGRLFSLDV